MALQPSHRRARLPPAGHRQQHVLAGDLGVGQHHRLHVGAFKEPLCAQSKSHTAGLDVVGIAQAVDERLAQRLGADPERLQHRAGRSGAVGVQHPQDQVVQVDRIVVERPGLVGGKVAQPLDLLGPVFAE
jgi:hypothetical protein